MNKIILISDNQIDTDLFNNQIFLEDTQRSETLASPVSQITVETQKEASNNIPFILLAIAIILIILLLFYIKKIKNYASKNEQISELRKENENSFNNNDDEIIEKRPRKRIKGQTYATPTSLNEAIRHFLNITKTK